jgi:hypothetical protein
MEDAVLFNLHSPSHLFIPQAFANGKWNHSYASAVENEIVKCGRSAYADLRSVLEMEHKYLSEQYFWITFFLPEDEVRNELSSWLFPGMQENTGLVKGLKGLLVSGIYWKLEEFFMKGLYLERKRYTIQSEEFGKKYSEGPTAIALGDSIQTTFFILGSAVAVCLMALAVEFIWCNRNMLSSGVCLFFCERSIGFKSKKTMQTMINTSE